MRSWVLGWGGSVEVVSPPSLREHVAATLRRGAQRYQPPTTAAEPQRHNTGGRPRR
jgi:hypothetical protein